MKYIILLILLISSTAVFSQETPPATEETMTVTTPPPPPMVMVPASGKRKKEKKQSSIIDFPDEETQFNGGAEAMQKFISANVRYPKDAISKNVQGRVFLSFIVKKNGKIKKVKVERGVYPSLDREAKRLILTMPKWIPGVNDGKNVNTRVRLPINFTLN